MGLRYAPRVKETTDTTGTGTYTLGGAFGGFQTFLAGLVDYGSTTMYCCTDGTDWEIGVGTLEIGGAADTLARTSVLASSNSGSAVNWTAGEKAIFCILPYQLLAAIQGGSDGAFSGIEENTVVGIQNLGVGSGINITDTDSVWVTGVGNDLDLQTELHLVYAFGADIRARRSNGVLFSNGAADTTGDTQHSLSNRSGATVDEITTGVPDTSLAPFSGYNGTVAYVIDVVARQTGGLAGTAGDSKWIRLEFLVTYATTPTLTLIGSVTTTTLAASAGAAAWTATVDVAEADSLQVTGEADKEIRWVASIKGIELGQPAEVNE